MKAVIRSSWTWTITLLLIVLWFPLLLVVRLFDRDPTRYRTGRWFRRLGVMITKITPSWQLEITGDMIDDPRRPYVVVSNHQSFADIPFISHLPWEMKWMAKEELFRLPFVGWMMQIAGDIPVRRGSLSSSKKALQRARWYLDNNCPVIIFPEGTRSPDGRVLRFSRGAFSLALDAGVPILPLVIEGSSDCLPKNSWMFGPPRNVQLHVMPPVETGDLDASDADQLCQQVRQQIVGKLAEMQEVEPHAVDAVMR